MNLNLQQLKVIIEIEKTRSLTKAAENLYISQPNLTRRVRELERDLGYSLFYRSSKGMTPTALGAEAVHRAKSAMVQLEAIGRLGHEGKSEALSCNLTVPKGSFAHMALARFLSEIDDEIPVTIGYYEMSASKAIDNVLAKHHDFAILQYRVPNEEAFLPVITENDLRARMLTEYSYRILTSDKGDIAHKPTLSIKELKPCIEIVSTSPFIPTITQGPPKKVNLPSTGDRKIYASSAEAQFELLSAIPNAYMWSPPVPDKVLEKHGLKLIACDQDNSTWKHKELLVYKRDLRMTPHRERFISYLVEFFSELR